MYGDYGWQSERFDGQMRRYAAWLNKVTDLRLVVVELGAGSSIPTVRRESERRCVSRGRAGRLIRINPREFTVPPGQISLAMKAAEAVALIDEIW
jgi:hypothetical protein